MNHWAYFGIGMAVGFGIGVVVMSFFTFPSQLDDLEGVE